MLDFPITVCNISGNISYVDLSINRVPRVCDCNKNTHCFVSLRNHYPFEQNWLFEHFIIICGIKSVKSYNTIIVTDQTLLSSGWKITAWNMSFSMSGLKVSGEKVEHISLALKDASFGNTDKSFCYLFSYK